MTYFTFFLAWLALAIVLWREVKIEWEEGSHSAPWMTYAFIFFILVPAIYFVAVLATTYLSINPHRNNYREEIWMK